MGPFVTRGRGRWTSFARMAACAASSASITWSQRQRRRAVSGVLHRRVLGLEGERVEEWRQGAVPFLSVRIDGGTIIDLFRAERDGENLNHLCLVLPRADWEEAVEQEGVEVTRGPAQLFGARGIGMAFYTRDPDGNTVELRHYGD